MIGCTNSPVHLDNLMLFASGDRNFFTSCYEWKQHEDAC